ncbi:MAG: hypothetical protein QM753_03480 [Thermomicrobiales bacterium]
MTQGLAHAAASNATPQATPVAHPDTSTIEHLSFLFVQSATSARFSQNPEDGSAPYLLTLKGHTGGTI